MNNKSQSDLYIYDELINNKEIRLEDIINKYNISIRTFRRYISEINIFLANNYKNQSVEYDYIKKVYYLK